MGTGNCGTMPASSDEPAAWPRESWTPPETDQFANRSLADVEILTQSEHGGLFAFVVINHCPAVFLGEQGALPRSAER